MNNLNEEKLSKMLYKNDLHPFFDYIFSLFKSNNFESIRELIRVLNQPKYAEYLLVVYVILDGKNSRKIKEYIKACFNISYSSDILHTFENSIHAVSDLFPNNFFFDEIFNLLKNNNIKSKLSFKTLCNYLKYLHVYNNPNDDNKFEQLLVRTLFFNNIANIVYSIDLIEFIIDHIFMLVVNKGESFDYTKCYFFRLFNKELIESILSDEKANDWIGILKLGIGENEDNIIYRDMCCLYFVFQYRIYFSKLKEKYLMKNENSAYFDDLFKVTTLFQYDMFQYFCLPRLYNIVRELNADNELTKLENCIMCIIADTYYYHSGYLNAINNNFSNLYESSTGCIKSLNKSIIYDNILRFDYKVWEKIFYKNPIIVSMITLKKILNIDQDLTKIQKSKIIFYEYHKSLEFIIKISQNLINTISVILKCTSIILRMINSDINNYGFLIDNSYQNLVKYVKYFNFRIAISFTFYIS
jgi:hypothetical protein